MTTMKKQMLKLKSSLLSSFKSSSSSTKSTKMSSFSTKSISKSEPNSFSSSYSSSSTSSRDEEERERKTWLSDGEITPNKKNPCSVFTAAFKVIDRDNDGKITRVELENLLKRVGGEKKMSDEEICLMVKEIDGDNDGCVTLEELEAAVGSALELTVTDEGELREAFDFFDGDHDGKITAEELNEVFIALGDDKCTLDDCQRMIEGVDRNGDGFVCFEDFTRMMDLQR